MLQCIQTGKTLKDSNQANYKTDQFYFRSANEMKQLFHYCPEAISNTGIIADRCNIDLYFGEFYLPHVENNPGENLDERLEIEAIEGLVKRKPHISRSVGAVNQELYLKRLHEELAMIKSMGFSGYFLIVSDFVRHAKDSGIIVGPGRGTSASSLVAYATGITDIDPLRYGLLYERFHNPSRMGMPDIDIDFCQEGRDEIIMYVTKKYGIENVAQIIRFGKMRAKSVIMDVGRAMNIPYSEVDAIANMIPDILYITIEEAFKLEPRLLEEAKKNEKIDKLLNLSRVLEGLNRHASTHDSGVVISDVPLVNLVPLYKSPKDDLVTQYPRDNIYTVGLTIFDFFGLKVLTMIQKAVQMIDENRGIKLHVNELSLDDKATYELLHQGNTDGVFQLENSGLRELLTILKPDCIEDVIAFIALYRPGPISMVPDFIARKLGETKITYEIPELEPILKETYGIILYQEQVMQIASVIGNYTMMEADILRRSMSRENAAKLEQEKQKFLVGAKVKKISGQKANKIWEQMETFCKYGFNKSHSVAYAMITYQTAYLKTHYPDEFWAAQT